MNQNPYDAFEDDLKAYLDDELSLFRRFQMRLHLTKCAHCAKELKTMQTISEELETEATPPLEADLRAKILLNVPPAVSQTKLVAPAPVVRRLNRPLLEMWGVGATITGAALCLFLTLSGNHIKNTFNSAANAITTGGSDYREAGASPDTFTSPAAPPAAAPPLNAPSELQKMRDESAVASRDRLSYNRSTLEAVPQQRAVHKQGSLSVAVDDAEAKGGAVEILVKNSGGFVANNALSTGADGRKTATLDVRVPVASFESVVGKISQLGTVREKTISGEDVTQQVTRAGVQRQSLAQELAIREAQLRALSTKKVAQRQATIAEVRQLRIEAAQARAQLEYLRKYADLSTLYVTLQDKQKVVAPASFSGAISETSREAWASFVGAAKLPAQLLIWVLAYCPLWIPALIVWRKWGRKLLTS